MYKFMKYISEPRLNVVLAIGAWITVNLLTDGNFIGAALTFVGSILASVISIVITREFEQRKGL